MTSIHQSGSFAVGLCCCGGVDLSSLIFTYTIVVLCVCLSTASISIAAYIVSRRLKYIPQALFFIAYFVELTQIFGGEWLLQNVGTVTAANYYAVDEPAFRILIGAVILACFWQIVFDIIDVRKPRRIVLPTVVLCVAQALILLLLPYGPLRQWLFYTMRQVSILSCLGYTFWLYRSNKDEVFQHRMVKRRPIFLVLLVFTISIVCEDTYVILLAPIPAANSPLTGVFLSSRNISENLMMIFVAAVTIYQTVRDLALRFNEPPEVQIDAARHNSSLTEHIEDRLPAYAQLHSLSKREREILALVVEGKSNREIASELILAEGTIKTHLHNIMKKCGQPNREDLKKDFWRS